MTNNYFFQTEMIFLKVYFCNDARAIPAYDADYIGFYLEVPDSAITYMGLVERIGYNDKGVFSKES